MKIEIENLKAQMAGRDLNIYQKADALTEFNKLIDYVKELEVKSLLPVVIRQSEQLKDKEKNKFDSELIIRLFKKDEDIFIHKGIEYTSEEFSKLVNNN